MSTPARAAFPSPRNLSTSAQESELVAAPSIAREMADRSTHSHDSGSEHSDERPTAPLPVWLVAGSSSRRQVPWLRAGHSLVAFSDRLYLFGGYCDYGAFAATYPDEAADLLRGSRSGIGVHFNALHEFSYDTGEWRVVHPGCANNEARARGLPKPRRHASIVVHGGSLFVYGGFDVDDNVLVDLWEFKVESSSWALLPGSSSSSSFQSCAPHDASGSRRSNTPVARAEHTAITYGNRMIIFGGYDGKKKLNDTYVFDFVTKQWSRPSNADHNSPSRRCKHSAVLYKKKMYVVGGFQFKDGDNYALTDMHALDLDTFVWSSILMGNSRPEALQGHKAVTCGDSMYVLGGKVRHRGRNSLPTPASMPSGTQSMPYMSGGDANGFHSMSLSALPSPPATVDIPFSSHILGHDNRGSGLNNTVFRYVFDANKWLPLETSGQLPAPRQLHAAVALSTGGGRGSIFLFGGTDRSKGRFFNDLCELRGIRISSNVYKPPCDACSSYGILLDNSMFSDVAFMVEGRKIHAHRSILYARSEYFRHMFESNMRESLEPEVTISNVSYDVFRATLEYLYSGKVRVTHGRLAVDLLKAADMFRIEGLRSLCVEKVEQAVTVDNAAFICQVADNHNAQHLKQYCITFMMQNFRDVIKSNSFQTLMRQDPGGLGHEILEAYSDNSPYSSSTKRARK